MKAREINGKIEDPPVEVAYVGLTFYGRRIFLEKIDNQPDRIQSFIRFITTKLTWHQLQFVKAEDVPCDGS